MISTPISASTKPAAVFLDRDGVINRDSGYVYRQSDFRFIPGIFDFCGAALAAGFKLVVVTNQSGIARGLYSENDFKSLTQWMVEQFATRGIVISGVYYCPHHPTASDSKFRCQCACRKPEPGMLLQARRELDLDLSASIVVGDNERDLEAGRRAGAGKLIYYQPHGGGGSPDAQTVGSLLEAIALLTV